MTRALPWLLVALMIGLAASLGVDAVAARQLSRQRADSIKVLTKQADSLERAIAVLETERLETAAKVRADSVATAEASKKVGAVVSRDTATQTAIILIEGEPRMAPLQLVDQRDALLRENASLRVDRLKLEAIAAGWMAKALNAEEQLALERANRPSRIQRMLSDGRKVLLGAGVTLLLLVL